MPQEDIHTLIKLLILFSILNTAILCKIKRLSCFLLHCAHAYFQMYSIQKLIKHYSVWGHLDKFVITLGKCCEETFLNICLIF